MGLFRTHFIQSYFLNIYEVFEIFSCMLQNPLIQQSCLTLTLNNSESCINRILNKVPMQEIFVNLTCIHRTPIYLEQKSWSQDGSVYTNFLVLLKMKKEFIMYVNNLLYTSIICISVNLALMSFSKYILFDMHSFHTKSKKFD